MKTLLPFLSAVLLALSLVAPHAARAAAPIDDAAALRGLKEAKGVFLIDFSNPKKTAFYLEIIRGTHAGLVRQGVTPDLVLVFIGETVRHLSTRPDPALSVEHAEALAGIRKSVSELRKTGVRMEVCAIATRVFGIDNRDLLPEMHVVGDGFISLIGWQSQGYRLVPIF